MKQALYRLLFFVAISFLACRECKAQRADTLETVQLSSTKKTDAAKTATPVQVLAPAILQQLNAISVADASKYFAGAIVKDYGGVGGLKTVSVRSLGANHTGIMYNGVMLGNAQGGQIDLGKFTLDNVEEIYLYNNAPNNILQTARAYSFASVLSVKNAGATNYPGGFSLFSAGLAAGSFGFLNPSLALKKQLSGKVFLQAGTTYMQANGKYNFISYENSTQKAVRTNSDIKAGNVEADVVYSKNDSNKLSFKTYYYNSRRGLPGAVIFFNTAGNQRLDDENFFMQATWQKSFSAKSRLLVNAKYSSDKSNYLDPAYQNQAGRLQNNFYAQENYFSAAFGYKLLPVLNVSLATDLFKNTLLRRDSFAINFAEPQRLNFLNNIILQFKRNTVELTGNLLQTVISEKVQYGIAGKRLKKLTPAIALVAQPLKNIPVHLRASFKKIFRAPTFNDLYYTNIGNTNLKPEYVTQYNAGATYRHTGQNFFKEILFTADAYYNSITDQILAVPRQNLFQWTMLNIGKVRIKGMDITTQASLKNVHHVRISARATYTFQQAWDVSDASSLLYKKQIPYTPAHSGSVFLTLVYKKISFGYSAVFSSYRYKLGEQLPENLVQGWSQHDINLQYSTTKKATNLKFFLALSNIANTQYEIIKFYPMPGFNYRAGITTTFKN